MKRSSTSSDIHEGCEKQPAAKRSWGLGSLLHGLAGYVRPKHGGAKEKSASSVANRETETLSRDGRECETAASSRPAINERVPVVNESAHAQVNASSSTRNETLIHLPKYESTLARSSTFSYTQSKADSNDQQQRTPLLPRFRRNSRNR